MLELFKIMQTEHIPEDTIVLISPLTYKEVKECKTVEEIFKLLFKKKRIIAIQNLNRVKK